MQLQWKKPPKRVGCCIGLLEKKKKGDLQLKSFQRNQCSSMFQNSSRFSFSKVHVNALCKKLHAAAENKFGPPDRFFCAQTSLIVSLEIKILDCFWAFALDPCGNRCVWNVKYSEKWQNQIHRNKTVRDYKNGGVARSSMISSARLERHEALS